MTAMRWTWMAVLVLFGAVAAAWAGPPAAIDTMASARGASLEAAMRVGVLDAVRRVNAAQVAFDGSASRRFEDSLKDLEAALSAADVTADAMQQDIATLSRGLVATLRLLDQRTLPDNTVEASVRVGVVPFSAKVATRKTIAVATFQAPVDRFGFAGSGLESKELCRKLADSTIEHLVRASVLTVLDRQHVEEVAKERDFVQSWGRTPEELARFGKMLGADYLLVGSIEAAGLDVVNQTVEASGYTFSQAYAGIEVKARLLDVESGAIRWADTVRVTLGNSDLNKLFPGGVPEVPATSSELVDAAAARLTDAIVEAIAPIKVALVDGETVWVNRGSGRLAPGMRLMIRGGGQDVIDPDTGEHLGQAERTVAVVEVVSVDARKSQCRITEGRPEDIRIGQVVRPMAQP